jgi:hypothetical protein
LSTDTESCFVLAISAPPHFFGVRLYPSRLDAAERKFASASPASPFASRSLRVAIPLQALYFSVPHGLALARERAYIASYATVGSTPICAPDATLLVPVPDAHASPISFRSGFRLSAHGILR